MKYCENLDLYDKCSNATTILAYHVYTILNLTLSQNSTSTFPELEAEPPSTLSLPNFHCKRSVDLIEANVVGYRQIIKPPTTTTTTSPMPTMPTTTSPENPAAPITDPGLDISVELGIIFASIFGGFGLIMLFSCMCCCCARNLRDCRTCCGNCKSRRQRCGNNCKTSCKSCCKGCGRCFRSILALFCCNNEFVGNIANDIPPIVDVDIPPIVSPIVPLSKFKNISFVNPKSNEICSICLKKLQKHTIVLQCKHRFHNNCMNEWSNKCKGQVTCPYCRALATKDETCIEL